MIRLVYLFSYLGSIIKVLCYKMFFGRKFICSITARFFKGASIELRSKAVMEIKKGVSIRNNSRVSAINNAKVVIGEGTGINRNCCIVAHERIIIGKNVEIGPNVMIYDHDHNITERGCIKNLGYHSAPITIEDNVWIGAGVIILKGVHIGEGSVIAAGTIVNQDVDSNTIVYDKRMRMEKKRFEEV